MHPTLEQLGISIDLGAGDLIASAVMITKIVKPDGSVVVGIYDSDGMSWVDQLGLLAAAKEIIRDNSSFDPGEDDE